MLRYAITDCRRAGDASACRDLLRSSLRRWSALGIDFIQLREKALPAGELFRLTQILCQDLLQMGSSTRLLVNARADIAVAAGAHGVHLTSSPGELTPGQVQNLYASAGLASPVLSTSCHTVAEAARAREAGAGLVLFGPVFEKVGGGPFPTASTGLALLRDAANTAGPIPVLALGGVTVENTPSCLAVGAAGVAGIRLFD